MADYLKFSDIGSGFIAITQNCNTRCKHCYVDCDKDKPHTPLSTVKKSIEKYVKNRQPVKSYGRNSDVKIAISGGEALLHPDIEEILDYGRELCKNNIKYYIGSNGIILQTKEGKELVKKLRKKNMERIDVSDDGYHPNIDIDKIERRMTRTYPKIEGRHLERIELNVVAIGRGLEMEEKWINNMIPKCGYFMLTCSGIYSCIKDKENDKTIDVVPFFADFEGKLRYCAWFAGFLGTVDESMEKIKERFDNDRVYKLMRQEAGLHNLFGITSALDEKYDYLPANCARCHAITRDEELMEEINLWLKASENEKKNHCPLA